LKKIFPALVFGILFVGSLGYLAMSTDECIEVNAMTGAVRTKTRYACVFSTPWKVRPTWITKSAERQGIPTEDGWRYLSVVSVRLFSRCHACGRAPASYPLQVVDPADLGLTTNAEMDRFARDFVMADESKRKQMLTMP
jgi:hypothetical protein